METNVRVLQSIPVCALSERAKPDVPGESNEAAAYGWVGGEFGMFTRDAANLTPRNLPRVPSSFPVLPYSRPVVR